MRGRRCVDLRNNVTTFSDGTASYNRKLRCLRRRFHEDVLFAVLIPCRGLILRGGGVGGGLSDVKVVRTTVAR